MSSAPGEGSSPQHTSAPAPGSTAVGPLAVAAQLRRDLAASRRELVAARAYIDVLLAQDALAKNELARLKRCVAETQDLAFHDALTSLPNRRLLHEHFTHAVARAARRHTHVAILFLDLDGFKNVNDSLGHEVGDRLLQEVATRLATCVRASDTACRWGGDEFAVLLPDLDCRADAIAAAGHIRKRLEKPYLVGRTRMEITTSVGLAVYPLDAESYEDLLRLSDRAMYRDKQRRTAASPVTAAAASASP